MRFKIASSLPVSCEYLGKLPEAEFHQAARTAIAQAPPQERKGLLGGLLGALGGGGGAGGGGLSRIASLLGLRSTDPDKMSEDDGARVMDYARRERPVTRGAGRSCARSLPPRNRPPARHPPAGSAARRLAGLRGPGRTGPGGQCSRGSRRRNDS